MATEMQQYRATAAQWALANPILADGELGFEQDTQVVRIGDGITPWNSLDTPYIPGNILTARGDLFVGSGARTATRVPSPTFNQTLTVQADGTLAWQDVTDLSTLETISHASSTYETISSETTFDATLESAAHAASVYVTNTTAAAQHALYDTLDHMDATYLSKARATSSYEPGWVYKIKANNTTRTSTTTLTADPDLVFPVVAGGTYSFQMGLFLDDPSNAADFLFGMTVGLASSWHAGLHGAPTTASTTDSTLNHRLMGTGTNELLTIAVNASATFFYVSIKGIAAITTAGNFGLTWAQNVSAASPGTVMYKGSYLKASRVA